MDLIRPAGVPIRVRIGGSASKPAIDDFAGGSASVKVGEEPGSTVRCLVGRKRESERSCLELPRAGFSSIRP